MSKDANKRNEEKEKIEAEISRSLSVAKMKEVHKQIEDIEKSRKTATVQSIINRIRLSIATNQAIIDGLDEVIKASEEKYKGRERELQSILDAELDDKSLLIYFNIPIENYESIRLDIQRNCDIKDFEKMFPLQQIQSKSPNSLGKFLPMLNFQLADMLMYLARML